MASSSSSTQIFRMRIFFHKQDPNHPKAATLQIRLKNRVKVFEQTNNEAGKQRTSYEVAFTAEKSEPLTMLPHVVDQSKFRKRFILDALMKSEIDKSFRECMWAEIERFMKEKTKGFNMVVGFAVVAEIEIIKLQGFNGLH